MDFAPDIVSSIERATLFAAVWLDKRSPSCWGHHFGDDDVSRVLLPITIILSGVIIPQLLLYAANEA